MNEGSLDRSAGSSLVGGPGTVAMQRSHDRGRCDGIDWLSVKREGARKVPPTLLKRK